MKLHLPKALAAAVMALFAIPNALAEVTFTKTSTLTKGVDYFLPYAKGAIVLTLSDSFTSIADNTTLVVAKAQNGTTENKMSIATKVETVTSGETQTPSVKLQTLWNDSASGRSTSSSAVTDSQQITVHFTGNTSGSYQGTSVYTGATSTETDNRILYDSGLRSTSNLLGSAYTYSVANTDKIASASFLDSSVGIIKNLSGSGDMTRPTASFVIIEGSASKDAPVGNNDINLDFGGKTLSFAGHVSMGNLTTTDATWWGQGIYVAKGASLTAQSINCNWNPGTMVINGEIEVNAFRMSTAELTEIKGVGSMTVGTLSTNNGGQINTSLSSFTVTGNTVVGEGTSGASNDALTVSGGVFTVNGTTTVASGRTLTVSGGGNVVLTGATTINGAMSISESATASFGDLNLSGRFVNTGSLSIRDGATVTFNDGCLKYCAEGELATGNGFGVFNSVALKDVLGENATIGTGITWKQGTAEISLGTDNVFTLANEVTSATTYYINDANATWDYTGATKIVINATNADVVLENSISADITVNSRAVLDLSGQKCGDCDLVLAGGSLTNNGGQIGADQKQLNSLTLTANSTVNAEADKYYGVVAGGWGDTFIDLGGYMLTKTGAGQFYAASTNLRGGGTLKITGGDFNLGVSSGSAGVASIGHTGDTKDTNIWFTGGTLSSGKGINLNRNVEFLAKAEDGSTAGVTGTISAALNIGTNTATFKANSQNDKLIISGMISGSGRITVDGEGEVQYKNSTTGTNQNLANSVVEIKSSAKLNLLAEWKLHTYLGALTGDGILQSSCASRSGQADGYRATVISGDASGFTGEWLLETASGTDNGVTSNRRVSGVLNTGTFGGVVKFTGSNGDATKAGSQLLLAQDTSIAGLEGGLTNAVVKGITYITTGVDDALRNDSFTVTERTLTIAGNKNLSFSGKVDSLVSLVVGDGTNAASQTFDGATIGGSMELKDHATVTATGDTTIAALKGTGTLTTSDATVTNGSAFTGTLEATGGTLAVTQVGATLAAVKAEGGDINLLNTSSVSVTDMVIGAGQTVGVFTEAGMEGDVSVTTLKVTSSEGSAATLNANLELSAGGTLTLNGTLAMGSTLTLNSGITLSGSLLDSWMDRSNALTLFSGVDGLNVNGVSVLAGETNGVKASDVFGDGWSNYNLVMTGGANNKDYNVQLVQTSDVPEPTTATLSLLALMGLAARRRRKAAK